MSGKRIIFNTNTPNDQGFRIPNDVLNFNRYQKNPVILKQHKWDELPLGRMTDIQYNNGEWTGVPVFHRLTADSREHDDLYQADYLKACSIGGFKTLKTTGKKVRDKEGTMFDEIYLDTEGVGVATDFDLYEVSMVTLPSNADAVTKGALLAAKCYDEINIQALDKELTTLSSKIQNMKTEVELAAEAEELKKTEAAAAKLQAEKDKATLAANASLPPVIQQAIDNQDKTGLSTFLSGFGQFLASLAGFKNDKPESVVLAAPVAPSGLPITIPGTGAIDNNDLPGIPAKLKAEKAAALETAKLAAAEALASALAAKDKSEKDGATQVEKDEFAAAKLKADQLTAKCAEMEADMDDSGEMKAAKEKEKSQMSSKIKMKTVAELQAEQAKLAAPPQLGARIAFPQGTPPTMSKLSADANGKKLIDRVTNRYEGTTPQEYATYMGAMRNEPKYKEVFDKVRIVQNADESKLGSYRTSGRENPGFGVDAMIAKLQGGNMSWLGRDGQVHERQATNLTATDTFLASPDLFAMDFLDLAIFKLFPTTSWKNDIPIFGAQTTENNTGLIWANITANPTIYMGNQPVNPTDYTYTDDAVSLNLTPYWMQPMLWTPLTMAQLRYDQMSTGWAQAFAVLGTYIDDQLLYTLASTVPHQSIVYSSGISPNPNGGNTAVQTFTLIGNADDPNSFYYNPLFQGTLNNPTLNDIIRIEQIYNKQNYELEQEKPVVVMDPTTDSLIAQTSQSQSLLTKWITDNGKEQLAFKHTRFNQRSRVVIFDPTTAQVKSPTGIIPATATSANLAFIPSQVGIGIGNLDVFMIQSPSNYGYRMSADVRMGIVPLRKNYNGTALYVYGPQTVS